MQMQLPVNLLREGIYPKFYFTERVSVTETQEGLSDSHYRLSVK